MATLIKEDTLSFIAAMHTRHDVALCTPAKHGIFEQFIYKHDHFAKTVRQDNIGRHSKKMPFFAPDLT